MRTIDSKFNCDNPFQFQIRNNGPSNIRSLDILISLPLFHINPVTSERQNIVDINSVSVKSSYNGQNYEIDWIQNGNQPDESSIEGTIVNRDRRSLEDSRHIYFNPYLQRLIESDGVNSIEGSTTTWNNMLVNDQTEKDTFDFNKRLLSYLPSNRTTYFECKKSEPKFCLSGRLRVTNLKTSNAPLLITLNFTVDLNNVAEIMTEKKDIFVIRTSLELMKTGDEDT